MRKAPCADLAELRSAYVDGALSDADRERLLAHLVGCSTCREDIEGMHAVRALLTHTREEPEPAAPDLSSRLVSIAGQEAQEPLWTRPFRRTPTTSGFVGLPSTRRVRRLSESCRQDIAQHYQRLFVRAGRNGIQTRVGVRSPNVLGLCAVNLIAEDPTASSAMRVHPAPAVFALAAGRDAGNQNAITFAEGRNTGTDGIDNPDTLVPENSARCAGWDMAFQDVQVRTADRRLDDFHNCITGRLNFRL